MPEIAWEQRNVVLASLDLEMSGLDPDKNGIIQIGLWATGQHEGILRGFYMSDCNPEIVGKNGRKREIAYDPESMKVNGLTHERVMSAPPMQKAIYGLIEEIRRYKSSRLVLVGSNIANDLYWLETAIRLEGFSMPRYDLVDIGDMTEIAFGERMGLNKAASKVGVKNAYTHDALADAWCGTITAHRLALLIAKKNKVLW